MNDPRCDYASMRLPLHTTDCDCGKPAYRVMYALMADPAARPIRWYLLDTATGKRLMGPGRGVIAFDDPLSAHRRCAALNREGRMA